MTLIELLSDLRSRGVVLSVDGDRLSCNAPKGVITAAIRGELTARKQEILKLLEQSATFHEDAHGTNSPEFQLSRSQRRLWFLGQMDAGNPVYNIAITLRLVGSLNCDAFEQALRTIVLRHESLRTRFLERDGMPYAMVENGQGWKLAFNDLSPMTAEDREKALSDSMTAEAQRPFALDIGPLFRVTLYRRTEQEHIALLVMHHIISDGWSIGVLAQELGVVYEALISGKDVALPPLPLQYRDFVKWEAEEEKRTSNENSAYWQKQLGGELPQLDLPTDRKRPAVQTFRGHRTLFDLDSELESKLQKLAQETSATFFMVLSAAFSVLLRRYTRQEDILIGTPTAGRTKSGFEGLIGFFVNNLVLRFDLTGNPSFSELVQRVRRVALDAFEHQSTPFDRLVEMLQPERSPDRSPLFQILFSLHNTAVPKLRFNGLEMQPLDFDRLWARFDLAVDFYPHEKNFRCSFEFNTDIFDEATVQHMMLDYLNILRNVAEDSGRPISSLGLLDESVRRKIIHDWNSTAALLPPYVSVAAWFRAQARATPDATALEMGDRILSYQELDAESDRLAVDLRSRGFGRGAVVGVYMHRSVEMVVGLLGILKAGAAYLPIDPALPARRIEFLLSDAQVGLILTGGDLADKLPMTRAAVVRFEEAGARIADGGPDGDVQGSDLAYLIYTSGTTGNPKGTKVHNEALVNLLGSMLKEPGLTVKDTLVAVTTISFDIAGLEIFGPLLCGAKLVLASRDQTIDPELLSKLLDSSGATVLQATPSTFRMLVESGWTGRSTLRMWCGGEALSPDLAEGLLARSRELWNLYGPTETTIWSAVHRVRNGEDPVLIGRPIANTQMYILDDCLEPVPLGVAGELFIGGHGVASGYWNRPELTASRFLSDPFDPAGNRRVYRTGDMARYRRDGQIQLLGRTDHQIKLRGHRIELGEIELAIERHPSVRQAVVVVQGEQSEKQLAGYIRFETGSGDASLVRMWLHDVLPDYMVPSVLIPIDEFPLTPNGKIDRKQLPSSQMMFREPAQEFAPARSRTEKKLSELWSRLLHIESPGIRENFFDLGGHSLLLVQLHSQLKREFRVDIAVVDLFRYSTIETLALFLERKLAADMVPLGADAR